MQDAPGTIILHLSKPVAAIIVGAEKPVARNVFEMRDLGEGSVQLLLRKVESVVVDVFAGVLEGLE